MTFEEDMRAAAHKAESAVEAAMRKYVSGGVSDEPEITAYLMGRLDALIDGQIGGLTWDTQVVRNKSGSAAEERRTGADILIHVQMETEERSYNKGALIQAKRAEPEESLSAGEFARLKKQCATMLTITPAAFVFDYAKNSMRVGSATAFIQNKNNKIYHECIWTPYRFFLELFRCPIGDTRITTGTTYDLVPSLIRLKGVDTRLRRGRFVRGSRLT